MIDIRGLDKARVLVALCDAARPAALPASFDVRDAVAAAIASVRLSEDAARALLKGDGRRLVHVSDACGRILDVKLSDHWLVESGYDAVYGKGRAAKAVASLRCSTAAAAV